MTESPGTLYDTKTVTEWLDGMVQPLSGLLPNHDSAALIGIRRGGVDVGRYLHEKLKLAGVPIDDSLGELNVNALAIVPYTFMRDPQKPISLLGLATSLSQKRNAYCTVAWVST